MRNASGGPGGRGCQGAARGVSRGPGHSTRRRRIAEPAGWLQEEPPAEEEALGTGGKGGRAGECRGCENAETDRVPPGSGSASRAPGQSVEGRSRLAGEFGVLLPLRDGL